MQAIILPNANTHHLAQKIVLPFAKVPFHKRAVIVALIALTVGLLTAGLFALVAELIKQDKVNISKAPPVF